MPEKHDIIVSSMLKLFPKVKEIRSKAGELHFIRWQVARIPFTNINLYLHLINKADEDKHQHDHPWNFISFILKGGYYEKVGSKVRARKPFSLSYKKATDTHRVLDLFGKTYSLVLTFGKRRVWGYQTEEGWVDFMTYRVNKNK